MKRLGSKSLENLQSMRIRWSFFLWACDNLLLVKLWQNPLSQQNKGSRSVFDKECEKSLPCPAPPIDDADKQLVPREAHHNLEMLECLLRKAVLIHQNISATNCGNQNVPIHSGRCRWNIKFRFIQLLKSDAYFSDNLASASPRLEGEVDVLTKHFLAYNVAIIALNCSQ